eukprot:2741334-Rhodomonas_salina.2
MPEEQRFTKNFAVSEEVKVRSFTILFTVNSGLSAYPAEIGRKHLRGGQSTNFYYSVYAYSTRKPSRWAEKGRKQ